MTDTVLKVSRSLYCFTTHISHGVENFFPRQWGTYICDAIFCNMTSKLSFLCILMKHVQLITMTNLRYTYGFCGLVVGVMDFGTERLGFNPPHYQVIEIISLEKVIYTYLSLFA